MKQQIPFRIQGWYLLFHLFKGNMGWFGDILGRSEWVEPTPGKINDINGGDDHPLSDGKIYIWTYHLWENHGYIWAILARLNYDIWQFPTCSKIRTVRICACVCTFCAFYGWIAILLLPLHPFELLINLSERLSVRVRSESALIQSTLLSSCGNWKIPYP